MANDWIGAKHPAYLVPVRALSVIFRAKLCATLEQAGLLARTPARAVEYPLGGALPERRHRRCGYSSTWPATCFASRSATAAWSASSTARCSFVIATTAPSTCTTCACRRSPSSRRFLQHVLPRGLAKVRYYGSVQPERWRAPPSSARAARQRGCALGERDARHADRIAPPAVGIARAVLCTLSQRALASSSKCCAHHPGHHHDPHRSPASIRPLAPRCAILAARRCGLMRLVRPSAPRAHCVPTVRSQCHAVHAVHNLHLGAQPRC